MHVPNWMPIIFYAVVIMLFLGVYAARHLEDTSEKKPFTFLCFLTSILLISDFISRLEIYESVPHLLVVAATYFLFGILPILGVYWYQFVRSTLSVEERTRVQRLDIAVFLIAGIGLATVVLNPFFGLVFSYDIFGNYVRGLLFFIPAFTTFLCIAIAEIFLLLRVRSLGRNFFVSLVLFPVPIFIGSFIGMYSENIPWVPLGISLSLVILFAVTQTTSLSTDFLTGLSNRKKFEDLVDERRAWAHQGRTFAAIMIDLDDFKTINDTMGHTMGDVALAEAASILQRCVRVNDTVARLGGDEFAILVDYADEEVVNGIINRINSEVDKFNAAHSSFKLAMSMGYELYDPEKYADRTSYLKIIDARMYANKQQRKAALRTAVAS